LKAGDEIQSEKGVDELYGMLHNLVSVLLTNKTICQPKVRLV